MQFSLSGGPGAFAEAGHVAELQKMSRSVKRQTRATPPPQYQWNFLIMQTRSTAANVFGGPRSCTRAASLHCEEGDAPSFAKPPALGLLFFVPDKRRPPSFFDAMMTTRRHGC